MLMMMMIMLHGHGWHDLAGSRFTVTTPVYVYDQKILRPGSGTAQKSERKLLISGLTASLLLNVKTAAR